MVAGQGWPPSYLQRRPARNRSGCVRHRIATPRGARNVCCGPRHHRLVGGPRGLASQGGNQRRFACPSEGEDLPFSGHPLTPPLPPRVCVCRGWTRISMPRQCEVQTGVVGIEGGVDSGGCGPPQRVSGVTQGFLPQLRGDYRRLFSDACAPISFPLTSAHTNRRCANTSLTPAQSTTTSLARVSRRSRPWSPRATRRWRKLRAGKWPWRTSTIAAG